MKENGWDLDNLDKERRLVLQGKQCDLTLLEHIIKLPWLVQGWLPSMISTTFWSKGKGELQFSNCNNQGEVSVLIDGTEVGKSKPYGEKTTARFNFDEASNLTIKADRLAIVKLFSLKIKCGNVQQI